MTEADGKYPHREIEKKWQERWEREGAWHAEDGSQKLKQYLLIEFPYPSGDGLHVGHIRSWTAMDVVARKRRAQGQNVLYPIGWDAFGLPAENYALKTGVHPATTTKENTDNFRRQIKSLGISFDWSREINTTDPAYYQWTQWIFIQMFKKGLAYKTTTLINWCPKDQVTLANEEVVDGACERCGTPVEKREKEQWMLAITKYAQRLYDDLDLVDYIPAAKVGQRNWIGPSEGAELSFDIVFKLDPKNNEWRDADGKPAHVTVFTTRPDTLFGATYLVLAPEHPWVAGALKYNRAVFENTDEVAAYVAAAKSKSDIERGAEGKEKTGVELKGIKAINPATKGEVPVFIADYVLGSYGTGAIMAVPAHDARDFEFAQKFGLPMREVVMPHIVDTHNPPVAGKPSKTRRNVHAVVYDPRKQAYLILRSEKFGWDTVVIGGVEDGESAEEAARREVLEETGYTDLVFKHALGGPVKAEYFAKHKDENRISITTGLYFELGSGKTVERADPEVGEVLWVPAEQFTPGTMVNAELPLWLERLAGQGVYAGPGILINSGQFDGMDSEEAKKKVTEFAGGQWVTTYKLRDWVFGRQRYWGEPIPMINCPTCGWQPVPDDQLPVKLPETDSFKPGKGGESPLASMQEWVNTTCPKCGGKAVRETDVMPQWAGSSWYYLRYTDPHNAQAFASKDKLNYWTPVDWYNGGMEHTTLHLLYSRFWHKFLFDQGLVPTPEPYAKRTSHGLILAEGGEKMSKSKGNTVSPDALVEQYGADALRLYEMFIGPFDQPVTWSTAAIAGARRFLDRAWRLVPAEEPMSGSLEALLNQTIKKVGEDIEMLKLNTAVSSLMILLNELEKMPAKAAYEAFIQLLLPFAPHLGSELAQRHGIDASAWPAFDTSKLATQTVTIGVQIDGKVRSTITLSPSATKEEAVEAAKADSAVAKWLGAGEARVVYVPGKILSFSTKP